MAQEHRSTGAQEHKSVSHLCTCDLCLVHEFFLKKRLFLRLE